MVLYVHACCIRSYIQSIILTRARSSKWSRSSGPRHVPAARQNTPHAPPYVAASVDTNVDPARPAPPPPTACLPRLHWGLGPSALSPSCVCGVWQMTLTDTRAILLTDIEMDGSFFEASAAPPLLPTMPPSASCCNHANEVLQHCTDVATASLSSVGISGSSTLGCARVSRA